MFQNQLTLTYMILIVYIGDISSEESKGVVDRNITRSRIVKNP